ncbi:DinB family protein [Actinoplanes sp. NPDC049596]|uniref:DinB family protein n=1 Tax=unclassified Actinoplanes TaxID=2626549 RepID=UPI0034285F4F
MTTWTAPSVDRTGEPHTGPERAMLQGWLDWHRGTLLSKCAGLTADQLRRPSAAPSNLTLLGLVRHMSYVERVWFRQRIAHEPGVTTLYNTPEHPDADLEDIATTDPAQAWAVFTEECAAADRAVTRYTLDQEFPMDSGAPRSLRWVYLHMIEEYARHNGHADLLRERLDGTTGA